MSEKSYVSLERHLCLVCGAEYDTGSVLLDRHLRTRFEKYTTTGWGLCPEHQQLFDDGFIALVECDPAKSYAASFDRLKRDHVHRTGKVLHLKWAESVHLLNVSLESRLPLVFVEPGVIEKLQAMVQP